MNDPTLETLPWSEDGAPARPGPDLDVVAAGARYDELGLLGRGGMGEVWRVFDRLLERSLVRKVLRADRAADPTAVRRFTNEARITAHLQHPGVVPVHDMGLLDDGRPFYTMEEVVGERLSDVVRAAHRPPGPLPTRRLVALVQRVAEMLALAHSRNIVHRDLKPSNVMVGQFGSVRVLDWGIARATPPVGVEEFPGRVVGTPAYVSPEMARGDFDAVGPASDVFALGAILHTVLTGRPPRSGRLADVLAAAREQPLADVPAAHDEALADLVRRATTLDPANRLPDASHVAEALADWLDGTARRERARRIVAAASAQRDRHAELRSRVQSLRSEAATLLAGVQPDAPDHLKKPGWRLEDEADRVDGEARLADSRHEENLQAALRIDPDLAEAHEALAALYQARHQAAELRGDTVAASILEQRLRTHDRGEHAAYLAGNGRLTLLTEPPGATVRLFRFVMKDRRLVPIFERDLGCTPLREVALERGSYLTVLEREGHASVRYPVVIERDRHWDGIPPGGTLPLPIVLPTEDELGPDEVYVPAGWFQSGGDPDATDSLPARRWWVDAFVIGRHPVTHAEYLQYLNGLVAAGRTEEAEARAPTHRNADNAVGQRSYGRTADGGFRLQLEVQPERTWTPDMPVVCIDWHSARACCSAWSDHPWRLPHSLEWEKAARGVDGRRLPWGEHMEPTWAAILDHPSAYGVEAFPLDESVYGVRGLVGNTRDLCSDSYRTGGPTQPPPDDGPEVGEWRLVRGGNAQSGQSHARPAARLVARPDDRFALIGFRRCRGLR